MPDVVQRADVRMGKQGDGARLSVEALAHRCAGGVAVDDDLDGNDAVEPCITGAIDLAHTAGAERRVDFVRSEASSPAESHSAFSEA